VCERACAVSQSVIGLFVFDSQGLCQFLTVLVIGIEFAKDRP
jgi:hypothetical protein